MSKIVSATFAFVLITLTMCFPFSALSADTGTIAVHVTALRDGKGVVRVALFNSKNAFSKDKGTAELAFKKGIAQISDNRDASCSFTDVPLGTYAIKLYHDEDNSGKFYTGMLGIPKVQYGFSNNATGMFGPPSFDKAKFNLNSAQQLIDVKLIGGK